MQSKSFMKLVSSALKALVCLSNAEFDFIRKLNILNKYIQIM